MTNHNPTPTLTDDGTDVLDRNDTVVTTVSAPHQRYSRFVPSDTRLPFSTLSLHSVTDVKMEYRPYDGLVGRQAKRLVVTLANGETVSIDLYHAKAGE